MSAVIITHDEFTRKRAERIARLRKEAPKSAPTYAGEKPYNGGGIDELSFFHRYADLVDDTF
jgi:hypothetical protein